MATTCGSCSTLKKVVVKKHTECFRNNISEFKRYRSSVKKFEGAEALVKAAKLGSHHFLKELIEAGADVNPDNTYDETALAAVIRGGHDACVHMLIEAGADVNRPFKYCFIEQLLLIYVVLSGREDYVNVLIKAGADVNQTNEKNQTALSTAASFGYHNIVDILIEAGADVNTETREPKTAPLLIALNSNDEFINSETKYFSLNFRPELCNFAKCVSSLIQAGADVNMRTIDGRFTPLIKAVENENTEFIKLLMEAGADVNMKNILGCTALKATEKNNQSYIDLLLDSGADVNIADNSSCTVLMKSVSLAPEYVEYFINKGADANATDCYGYSAFMHAAKDGNLDALKKLGHLNEHINQQSKLGSTAVILAAENSHGDCVNYLVKSGADVNIYNRAGATALHRSAVMGHVQCVNELIKAGADVNVTNMLKNTVLVAAAETGSVSCIKALLKAGAVINQSNDANALQVQLFNTRGEIKSGSLLLYAAGENLPSSPFVTIPQWLQHREVKLRLKHICRQAIRKHLLELDPHHHLFGRIPKLGLPTSLTSYLLFEMSVELTDKESNVENVKVSESNDSDDNCENDEDDDSDNDDVDDDVNVITESDQCNTQ